MWWMQAPAHRLIFVIKKLKSNTQAHIIKKDDDDDGRRIDGSRMVFSSCRHFIRHCVAILGYLPFAFAFNLVNQGTVPKWQPSQTQKNTRIPLKNALDFFTHILIIINKYWNVGNVWGAYVDVDHRRKSNKKHGTIRWTVKIPFETFILAFSTRVWASFLIKCVILSARKRQN